MVNKMNGESVDLTAQNIARLKELFPEILTDGEKINFDMLKAVLGGEVDSENERYQFTWHGKKKMIVGTQKSSKGTLRPDKDKSNNFDSTENLYIEGDNLEVLKLLQKSYNGKIKMIYIDPPYNTGKDFVYKDNFKDGVQNYLEQTGQVDSEGNILSTNSESNGRFHTDWLNMIYSRLKLARNLLTDEGAIFISIADQEQANLVKICNEVFGEDNFFTQIIVQSNKRGQTYKQIAKTHEYLLVYTKKNDTEFNELPKGEENSDLNLEDNLGKFNIREIRNRNPKFGKFNRPNLFYPFYVNPNVQDKDGFNPVSLVKTEEFSVEVLPFNSQGEESCWRWGNKLAQENINSDTLLSNVVAKQKNDGNYNIYEKYRKDTYKAKTIWDETEFIYEKGTTLLTELKLASYFDFPKPIDLIKRILLISTNKDDIVLDFFSGSATTAHATMQLNAEDGGNRKFIMVQLPEPLDEKSEAYKDGYRTICDIGEERIRRAGEKIKEELVERRKKAGMLDENIVDPESLDIGFKVLKLDTSNIREWNVDFADLEGKLDLYDTPFVDGRSELDIVYEIMLKQGLELTYPIATFEVNGQTVYDIAFGSLFVCLSQKITTDIAQAIIARRDEHGTDTSSVIFSDAGFETDSDKLNCIEILKDAGYPEDNLLTL